jgi:transcription factor-like protein
MPSFLSCWWWILNPSLQVVDETASITRQFESSGADDSASEESEGEQLDFALHSSLPASPIGFEENEIAAAPDAAIPIIPRTDHPLTPQPSLILDHAVTAPRIVDTNSVNLVYDAPTPIFSTDAGPDAAPFSLGLAISRGASPTQDIAQPVSQGTLVSLMSAFMWETADWCETTDSAKHFSTASIHTMMQSKPFVAAAMSLASRQIDNVKGRPQPTTLELYQYTIGLLLRQDPNEPDPSILAACTLLCVYEMMGSSVMEWRRHLKVRNNVTNSACVAWRILADNNFLGLCWLVEDARMERGQRGHREVLLLGVRPHRYDVNSTSVPKPADSRLLRCLGCVQS